MSLIVFERCSLACKCVGNIPVCERFAQSDAVFVGRVESVEPDFDFWSRSSIIQRFRQQVSDLEERLSKNENDNSPDTVEKLKELYRQILPEQYKPRIVGATNFSELEAVFEELVENGKRMRLKVQVVYKGASGDMLDVWTDFSDCAANLLKGETYLIYGEHGEKGRLETGACSGNRRLTDAGEDLSYLHFISHGGAASGRVFGFVTSNEIDLKLPRLWWNVPNPVPGLILRVESDSTTRYAETDRHGEFAFDGLEPGDYALSVLDKAFPDKEQILSGPRTIAVPSRGCVSESFYIPDTGPRKH